MSILHTSSITFGYHSPLLDQLSISFEKGELVAIIGPNGCGKTTLLKTLSGLLTPQQGQVYLDMKPLARMTPKEIARQIAAIEQHITLDFDFTVSQIVGLGRLPHQNRWEGNTTQDKELVLKAMAQTGIQHMATRSIHQLSSGERQRVWLAMALTQQPRVLLLDEPTSHLDLAYQLQMLTLLKTLTQEGLTVILSIHELHLIHLFADRIALMKQGSLLTVGSPQDVLTKSHLDTLFDIPMRIIKDDTTQAIIAIVPEQPLPSHDETTR